MALVFDPALQELRMRYQAAYTAHQACVRAVTEATMSGIVPSSAMLEQEAKALGALTKARAGLLAAMAEANGGAAFSEEQPRGACPE
jgi:hypothetical protein